MKKPILLFGFVIGFCVSLRAQKPSLQPIINHSQIPAASVYNAGYVKKLYAQYPTVKSNLCPACRLWINPFYKSVADTQRHLPVCEYGIVTKTHRLAQESLSATDKSLRSGVFAEWFTVGRDADVSPVYAWANKQIGKPASVYEIAYGHCGLSWILAAWCCNGMFFSDAKDYNEAAQYQGQNIGTQLASEDTTRELLGWPAPHGAKIKTYDTVKIWAGCYASKTAKTYTLKGVTLTVPDAYWKILVFGGQTVCYWMPDQPTETRVLLPERHIGYEELVSRLQFDPEIALR
jgi:hypothetical protein